jgi:hypothetical protein
VKSSRRGDTVLTGLHFMSDPVPSTDEYEEAVTVFVMAHDGRHLLFEGVKVNNVENTPEMV